WPLAWRNALAANRRSQFPTMVQMVAPYVAALSAHARDRPIVLVGHSFGGLLAFEAAHELRRRGAPVELVILLDTWARPPAALRVALHNWRQQWAALDRLSPVRVARAIAAQLRNSWRTTRWLLRRGLVGSRFDRDAPDRTLPSTILD